MVFHSRNAPLFIWLVIAAISLFFHLLGVYLLMKLKRKRHVSHYLLLHLSGMEIINIMWMGVFVFGHMDATSMVERSKVELSGVVFVLVGQYLSVILLTVDRVLAVALAFKYRRVVTARKLIIVFPVCWAICLAHGVIVWYFTSTFVKILLAWEIPIVVLLVCAYIYIFTVVEIQGRKGRINSDQKRRLNIKVPLSIVATLIAFYVVPDFLVESGAVQFSPWLYVVFYLNVLTDPVIYILGSSQMLALLCCKRNLSDKNIPLNSDNNQRYQAQNMVRPSNAINKIDLNAQII